MIFNKKLQNGKYFVSPKPPHISQLANADDNKTQGYFKFINDKAAMARFGAKNLDEFSYWNWRSCGIACVQMVLQAQLGDKFDKNTMQLVNEALEYNGYDIKNDIGWYHDALIKLAEKYGITAWRKEPVNAKFVAKQIVNNNYVATSLKSNSGGHLVLVYGVEIEDGKVKNFTAQDPYTYKKDGKNKKIDIKEFEVKFKKRVIVFENKK